MADKTWLAFVEVHDTGKTKVWDIHNAENGSILGQVKWSGAWRQYVFAPDPECIWNSACLYQLTRFIDDQMAARFEARMLEKSDLKTKASNYTDTK